MGHSRGGEGVAEFIAFNRARPAPGRKYNLQAVFALAPIDRNKQIPTGTNFATLLPACDGDVTTIAGANMFERGKYAIPNDPYAKIEYYVEGANHNFYNTRWPASDRTGSDIACGTAFGTGKARLTPEDQRKTGLATMPTFLRAYIGGETDLLPWLTGEAGLPASACPTGPTHVPFCEDVVKQTYIAPAGERLDILRPEPGGEADDGQPDRAQRRRRRLHRHRVQHLPVVQPGPVRDRARQPAGRPDDGRAGRLRRPALGLDHGERGDPVLGAAADPGLERTGDAGSDPARQRPQRVGLRQPRLPGRLPVQRRHPEPGRQLLRPAFGDPGLLGHAGRPRRRGELPQGDRVLLGRSREGGRHDPQQQPARRPQPVHRHRSRSSRPTASTRADLDRVEFRFGTAGVNPSGAIQFSDVAFQQATGVRGDADWRR